jgi:NADP-dependent 3-hydroxy acid dehydrogenase YdfG
MVSRFAAEGADVVIGSHREEQVTHLVDEPGRENVVFARTDVTNERRAAV